MVPDGSPVILILLYQGTLNIEFPPQALFHAWSGQIKSATDTC